MTDEAGVFPGLVNFYPGKGSFSWQIETHTKSLQEAPVNEKEGICINDPHHTAQFLLSAG